VALAGHVDAGHVSPQTIHTFVSSWGKATAPFRPNLTRRPPTRRNPRIYGWRPKNAAN